MLPFKKHSPENVFFRYFSLKNNSTRTGSMIFLEKLSKKSEFQISTFQRVTSLFITSQYVWWFLRFLKSIFLKKELIKLPHPRCHMRNFVLYPIKEIDPFWIHPILHKNIDFLIEDLTPKSRIEITRLRKSVIIKRW